MSTAATSTAETPPYQNRRAAVEMTAASLAFATMSCIAHAYSNILAWPLVGFSRIAITLAIVCVMLRWYRVPFIFFAPRELWARSLCGCVGLVCTFYAITHLPVTDQVTIAATGPIWVTIILAVLFKRRISASAWFHSILALAGVYVMYRPTFSAESFPIFVMLFGAIAFAGAMVSLSFCGPINSLSVVAHFSLVASCVTLILCVFSPGPIILNPEISPWIVFGLIPMGIAGTLGQILITFAYGRGNPTMVALTGISQIAFAALYDLAVWGYTFDLWKIIGVLMIAAAIALSIITNAKPAREG
ncbi:MAG TPA: DMT family transporter [Candidatus Hydrogenedentes bacterium]|nr:DMT family transporter [Candidatus Hydrogenedentota bacterium]